MENNPVRLLVWGDFSLRYSISGKLPPQIVSMLTGHPLYFDLFSVSLKVKLQGGEIETLLTNLDEKQLKYKDAADLYFKVLVTQAGAKFAGRRVRGFIQRFLKGRCP